MVYKITYRLGNSDEHKYMNLGAESAVEAGEEALDILRDEDELAEIIKVEEVN